MSRHELDRDIIIEYCKHIKLNSLWYWSQLIYLNEYYYIVCCITHIITKVGQDVMPCLPLSLIWWIIIFRIDYVPALPLKLRHGHCFLAFFFAFGMLTNTHSIEIINYFKNMSANGGHPSSTRVTNVVNNKYFPMMVCSCVITPYVLNSIYRTATTKTKRVFNANK